jgi:hypothetical protein
MPTVLRVGAYRFHFYSDESREPAHIHVRSPAGECKFWLEPVGLAQNRGVSAHELREIERLVFEHRELFLQRYHEYHNR